MFSWIAAVGSGNDSNSWLLMVYLSIACLGIFLNIVLLVVFFKQPDIRSPENLPLINLCFSDILHLIKPFIGLFLRLYTSVDPSIICLVVLFYSSLVISFNTYSIASISIVRHVVLFRFKNHLPEEKRSYLYSRLIMLGVWLVAGISATAVVILEADIVCLAPDKSTIPGETTLRLLIFGVVPTIIMVVFYIIPACKMRRSSSEESSISLQDRRRKITRIFIALALFFAVTKLSLLTTTWALRRYACFSIYELWAIYLYQYTQLAYIWNPAFNPIVLCVASSEFRKLYAKYCFYKETHVSTRPELNQSTTTQETELTRL